MVLHIVAAIKHYYDVPLYEMSALAFTEKVIMTCLISIVHTSYGSSHFCQSFIFCYSFLLWIQPFHCSLESESAFSNVADELPWCFASCKHLTKWELVTPSSLNFFIQVNMLYKVRKKKKKNWNSHWSSGMNQRLLSNCQKQCKWHVALQIS